MLQKPLRALARHSFMMRTLSLVIHPTQVQLLRVLEYQLCWPQGGDLRNALSRDLQNCTHEFDWYNKGKDVALAVARGLNFLHKNNVVHR